MNATSPPCAPLAGDDHRQQYVAALLSCAHRPCGCSGELYGEIHVTQKVIEELLHPNAPPAVRNWAKNPPSWLKIHPDPEESDDTLASLDPGERTALRLAEQLHSDVVLLDESAARSLATQRGLKVSGTLGLLCDAAQAGLLQFSAALDLLRKTNFRASPQLWKSLYSR